MNRVIRWLVTALSMALVAVGLMAALAPAQGGGVAESGCVSATTDHGNELACYGGANDPFTSLGETKDHLEGRATSLMAGGGTSLFAFVPARPGVFIDGVFVPAGDAPAPAEPTRYVYWYPEGGEPLYERIRKQAADGSMPDDSGNWRLLELPLVCDATDVLYGWGLAPARLGNGEWDWDSNYSEAFDVDYLNGAKGRVSCAVNVEPPNRPQYESQFDWYVLRPNDNGDYRFQWELD